jgi:hypothetical protein
MLSRRLADHRWLATYGGSHNEDCSRPFARGFCSRVLLLDSSMVIVTAGVWIRAAR